MTPSGDESHDMEIETAEYVSKAEVQRKYGLSAWHEVIKYRVVEHHREVSPDGSLTTLYYRFGDVVALGLPDHAGPHCPRCGARLEQWGRHHSDYNEACSKACGYHYSRDTDERPETIEGEERGREMIRFLG